MSLFSNKRVLVTASIVGACAFSSVAMANDYSQLVAGLDFSSAITAVITVAGAIAGVYGAIAGARGVLRMIKGA